jgi:hypothetical protein
MERNEARQLDRLTQGMSKVSEHKEESGKQIGCDG